MKKRVFLILLLIASWNCCLAGNLKQQKDEDFVREIINSPSARLSKHQLSLKQDYELSKNGDKNTLYSQILMLETKYKNTKDKSAKLNYKYVTSIKNLYLFTIETPYQYSFSEEFYNNFEKRKVIIPDRDYEKLDENLKELIPLINVYH